MWKKQRSLQEIFGVFLIVLAILVGGLFIRETSSLRTMPPAPVHIYEVKEDQQVVGTVYQKDSRVAIVTKELGQDAIYYGTVKNQPFGQRELNVTSMRMRKGGKTQPYQLTKPVAVSQKGSTLFLHMNQQNYELAAVQAAEVPNYLAYHTTP